mgnify:CR=1 FL=1
MGPFTLPDGSQKLTALAVNWHPSPNFGPRREGQTPSLIVIHYTAMQNAQAALDRLCDPAVEVSAHYLICRTGAIWQMVEDQHRAWHAGAGSWQGLGDVNSRSIGIELDNTGAHPFPEPQMAVLEVLLADLMARWAIYPGGVIGHSDMAPDRKFDPGPRFDWARLARGRMAAPTDHSTRCPPDAEKFRAMAVAGGYPEDASDTGLRNAVRLRHRPWAHGPLRADDMAVVAGLTG